ncbi:chaperone modulator CbpM [Robiginitalea sp. M366]|uniref:chaperone modulator CbpM n=1 Tax=Robiginitalea aestuariiviva TaxID=3036903 RepID=UPI00240E36E3|nr:chaperone modulator CbpM [Robiginitalea aestuariiviva]MDG1572441.1 chaperone modulator CbpM [Robiginitalea aestuariiviva]
MKSEKYIHLSDFCRGHALEEAFVFLLEEYELVRIEHFNSRPAIHRRDLRRLERLVRLHRDLEIGVPGLQAIEQLLGRMEALQEEMRQLRLRLQRHESRD